MSYEVTATKKRPRDFDQLVGQDFVVSTLRNSIETGRIAHAYLFSGPRGVGKTSAARILAKSLNCESGPTQNPCGKCQNCIEIAQGNSLDVIEIDGASNTSVNDVREIKDEVLFAPNSGRYKVYIIDEVHMLSNSAFNALLKTIEEPPPYIVFIFATTEIHKVPATIRSRCQQFNFRLIPIDLIKKLLEETAGEIGISAESDALYWIAKEATGSLRDAYTLFDQVAAFSTDGITLEKIREKLGLVGFDQMNEFGDLIAEGDTKKLLEFLEKVLCQGVSEEQFLLDMAEYMRNMLFIQNGITRESILGASPDRYSSPLLEAFSSYQFESALEMILSMYRSIRYSLNQRFELELLLSRLATLKDSISSRDIVKQIRKIRQEMSGPAVLEQQAAEKNRELSFNGLPDQQKNTDSFKRAVIQWFKKEKLALSSTLEKAKAWKMEGDKCTIYFQDSYSANLVKQELPEIKKKAREFFGGAIDIAIALEERDEDCSSEDSDEGVDRVKKVFRGEIIEGE